MSSSVSVAEATCDAQVSTLYPEERQMVATAVEKRRSEFATGRTCARRALRRLGVSEGPIGVRPDGAPRWPLGVTGSISHCEGFRACAVALLSDVAALGIDVEPHEPLPPGVWQVVATEGERTRIHSLGRQEPHIYWDKLIFSAKECVFKAWLLARLKPEFRDVDVIVDVHRNRFTAQVSYPRPASNDILLRGRWLIQSGFVAAAIEIPADGT